MPEEWGGQTQADLETIRTVREYLVEHEDVWQAHSGMDKKTFTNWKEGGVRPGASPPSPGKRAISTFLGGIWTEDKVDGVLKVIVPVEKGEVDEVLEKP